MFGNYHITSKKPVIIIKKETSTRKKRKLTIGRNARSTHFEK